MRGTVLEKKKIKTETEVQKANKDFVDLHAVDDKEDPEQEKQIEEKDVEEGNEFTKAAAKAKLAGEDEFEFDGKTYPTEISQDAAEKILGKKEEVELEEAKGFPESSLGAKNTYDAVVRLSASLRKGSKLNKAVNKRLGGKYDSDFVKMEKALVIIFDILDEFDREYRELDESANLEEAIKPEVFVKGGDTKATKRDVDAILSKIFINAKLAKQVENSEAYKAGYKSKGKGKGSSSTTFSLN